MLVCASLCLRFVPHCSSELAVLDPGVFKLSLLLLLLFHYMRAIKLIIQAGISYDQTVPED